MKESSSNKFYKLLQRILSPLNELILVALKAYLNTQVGQGSLKKFVNWLAENMYDETAKPILETLLIRIGYAYDVREGKVFVERLKKAQESGNASDYDSTVDDI